jgi:hypothetical protein
MDTTVKKIVDEAIKNKEPVEIVYTYDTDDSGDYMYAVSLINTPGFWLNAFITKKGAINFCKRNGLPIVESN